MSARRDIKPSLDWLALRLRRRHGIIVDVALMRDLRAFGVECHEIGVRSAHRASTIPAPADAPEAAAGDDSGRYSLNKGNDR